MIEVEIDGSSPVPPYEQLRSRIEAAVRSGELAAGSRLPTVRQLAADVGLAPNTVARAYRELEQAGVVVTRGRLGTTVADVAPLSERDRRMRLRETTAAYLRAADRLGFEPQEILDEVIRQTGLQGSSGRGRAAG